ncbi:excalibur calcium-binding domain-containing protein [Nonomuraea longicatena]|uniref:Excalibur calcium-binding domain-containing protein n=1 Tax=Nonomuraea longicatena TaxID=83682 RepID=A0ABN1QQB7_9ACTN
MGQSSMTMENQPVADQPEEPPEQRASRLTTIVLIVSLVLVIVIAGVLGAVAVIMTRSPDTPLLGAKAPQQLANPIHFAPVRDERTAPCPDAEAALDEQQTTCYLLEDGVTVKSVQRIEALRQPDGTYAVRIAMAPAFKERVSAIVHELAGAQRQLAVVTLPGNTVVAAPFVSEPMSGDSLSLAPMTKADAEALAAKLIGGAGGPALSTRPPATDPTGAPPVGPPPTGGIPVPSSGAQVPDTGSTAPVGQQPVGGRPTGGTPTSELTARDQKYADCKAVRAAGRGPYTKGRHPEFHYYEDVNDNGVACDSGDV